MSAGNSCTALVAALSKQNNAMLSFPHRIFPYKRAPTIQKATDQFLPALMSDLLRPKRDFFPQIFQICDTQDLGQTAAAPPSCTGNKQGGRRGGAMRWRMSSREEKSPAGRWYFKAECVTAFAGKHRSFTAQQNGGVRPADSQLALIQRRMHQ